MSQRRKSGRRSTIVKRNEPPHIDHSARGTSAQQPAFRAASTSQTVPDESSSAESEESPETDIAPTVLGHLAIDRVESIETDIAPSILDQDALPATAPPDPGLCSESDRDSVTAEDLH